MGKDIVTLFTEPSLDLKAVFSLKIRMAIDTDLQKELEVFLEDYDKAEKVIPAEDRKSRKGIASYLLGFYAAAASNLNDTTELSLLFKVQNLISLDKKGEARKTLASLNEKISSSSDAAILLHAGLAACDLREVEMAKNISGNLNSSGPEEELLKYYIDELEGRYQEALDGYEKVGQLDHDLKGSAIFRLARLQDLRGHETAALETYRSIEELGFQYEEALVNIGVLLEDKQDFTNAIRYYEKALKINPDNAKAKLYHSDAEACLDMYYDERQRKQDIRTTEILSIPISDFELSVRSRNCLSKMGIFTLKDLITKTEQELLNYKNFGETSLKEIRAMLVKKGLHLGMSKVEEQPLAERIKINTQIYYSEKNIVLDDMDTPIEDLNLSYRTKSALHKMGFESLRDITMRTGSDLEANENFSTACLQEVNALLEEKGFSYRPATSSGKPDGNAGASLLSPVVSAPTEAAGDTAAAPAETFPEDEDDD